MSLDTPGDPQAERRERQGRRATVPRRSAGDRRQGERRTSLVMVAYHRRVGGERRSLRERRGGADRRRARGSGGARF